MRKKPWENPDSTGNPSSSGFISVLFHLCSAYVFFFFFLNLILMNVCLFVVFRYRGADPGDPGHEGGAAGGGRSGCRPGFYRILRPGDLRGKWQSFCRIRHIYCCQWAGGGKSLTQSLTPMMWSDLSMQWLDLWSKLFAACPIVVYKVFSLLEYVWCGTVQDWDSVSLF